MLRRTKIVATLGPATDDPKVLDEVISAGVDVVRLNMSHGTHADHERRAEWVRNRARASGRQVGVLIDLQGPKIRCGKFVHGNIDLAPDDRFILDTGWDIEQGNRERVGVTYSSLHEEVARGDTLILNDGLIVLWVDEVQDTEVRCKVVVGGILSNSKGINKLGGGLSAPALTGKDKDDISFAARIEADYLAVSFVRSAEDVHIARQMLREAGGQGGIVSKIERAEAMDCIEEIVDASDVIMVARGDLGVEIGDAELPAAQKRLISTARPMNCVVITATQMMESMIQNPIPTRAEVFDVANAVMDGTDAVMLVGRISRRQISGEGRRGHGPGLQGGGKTVRDPPVGSSSAFGVRTDRRGDRDVDHVHGKPPRGGGDRRADRIRIDLQVDVAHLFGYPDLCLDEPGGHA